ncbi:O-antigen/teichoic acid export membrane protein [Maribacter spongiicola]|uniref:O-antigen/teichoic acid export membrane protein n=1 Tax=Maribacter spongiicola TaxID=1206753 RepID=A0A4R7K8G8_9FLAO|nr:MATE family efflux transporter [Maribacter spongiicola]TDT46718.1 O-antigen/teichoic acid export membrane protein [Maribacter spongiicola]
MIKRFNSIRVLIQSYFQGNSRTNLLVKNVFSSLILRGLGTAINFLFVPLVINFVNAERYGIWLTLSSVLTWFTLLDIGFGNGLRNKFSEAVALDDIKEQRKLIHTTAAVLICISAVIFILNVVFTDQLKWDEFLGVDASYRTELQQLVFLLISFFSLQFIFQIYNPIQYALQKPAMIARTILVGNALGLIGILYLREFSEPSLFNLGFVVMGSNVLSIFLFTAYFFIVQRRDLIQKIERPTLETLRGIFSLGIKFFFLNIAYMVQFQTSNFLISKYFTPEKVAEFNIAFKLFSVAALIFGIILSPVWSSVTNAQVNNDYRWIRKLINKLLLIWAVIAVGSIIVLLIAPTIYNLWIGDIITIPFITSLGVLLIVLSNCFSEIFISVLNGMGKVNLQFYMSILVIIFFVPIAYFLSVTLEYGIFGICMAIVITNVNGLIVAPYQVYVEMRKNRKLPA